MRSARPLVTPPGATAPSTVGTARCAQQQIIVYGLFELPFGRNKAYLNNVNAFVNQVVSGIQISPVINYSSGLPFTFDYSTCGADVPITGSAPPCYVNGLPAAFHPHVTGFPGNNLMFYQPYNLTANSYPFQLPGLDQIGNCRAQHRLRSALLQYGPLHSEELPHP